MGQGQRSSPAPFLTKTYQLVDDRSTNDVVSWNETGSTFIVWKTADFARELLPKYFKHNNFSSFVRQLNTYGFRKIVPEKWEFANDHFRRGAKELLCEIQRRKAAIRSPEPNPTGGGSSEELGSTSTSVEIVTTAKYADLSGENEELRKVNESLTWELARTRERCDEVVGFLTRYFEVGPDKIDGIVRRGGCGPSRQDPIKDDDVDVEESVKLFGVWVKGEEKKRGREVRVEEQKLTLDFEGGPLMKSRKVCN